MGVKRSVPVRILGHEYRIRTEADESTVQEVAALVDDTMARVRARTGTVDSLDVAVLAALNLANDLLAERQGGRRRRAGLDPTRLRALIDRVEEVVRDGGSPAP